jgi:hypothetical protein
VDALLELLPPAVEHLGGALEEVLEAGAGALVEQVEDLVQLDGGRGLVGADRAAVVDLGAAGRAELQVDVAVGDAGQRRLLDHHLRAAPQRLVVRVADPELDLRVPVLGHVDALDAADGDAAGLHLVALHDLAGVDELGRDRVAAVAAEQQHGDCDYRQEDQREC